MTRELVTLPLSRRWCIALPALLAAVALFLPTLGCGSGTSSGSGGDDGGLGPTPDASQPQVVTVSGTAVTGEGEPLKGVRVWMVDRDAVTTGADGRFSFADVQTPYTLAASSSSERVIKVLEALATESPVVVFDTAAAVAHSSSLAGQLNGFKAPADIMDLGVAFSFNSGTCPVLHEQSTFGSDGQYDVSFLWYCAKTSVTGVLDVIEYEINSDTHAVTFHTYGQKDALTLANHGALQNIDVQMESVGGKLVTGTAPVPAGMEAGPSSGGLVRDGRRLEPFGTLAWDGTSGAVQLAVPAMAGWAPYLSLTAFVSGSMGAQTTFNWSGAADQTAIADPVAFLGLPRQKRPANSAVDVAAAQAVLSWETELGAETPVGAERVFLAVLRPTTAGKSRIEITTPSGSVDFAALAALSVKLEAGERYSWTAEAIERRGGEELRRARSDLFSFTTGD